LADKAVACETIRIRIILKIAEIQGFLMRETVEVCPKSPFYGIFKAKRLDVGEISE
jgi:hypothetical protein